MLIERGVEIIEDGGRLVHVSGHPRRSELRQMYDWVKPQIAIPAHGEAAHLASHAALARELGVKQVVSARNGQMIRLGPGVPEMIDDVPHGRLYKDGRLIGNAEAMGISERRRLSFAGHVTVMLEITAKSEFLREPEVVCLGLPKEDAGGEAMEDVIADAVFGAVDSIPRARRRDVAMVQEAARRAVRAAAQDHWGKKPIVTVFVAGRT